MSLITQTMAIGLVAVVSYLLLRSFRRIFLRYWTAAWFSLFAALGALLASFWLPSLAFPLRSLYLLGEYGFGYLFVAGCRNYSSGFRLNKAERWMIVPGVAVACGLTLAGGADFNVIFIPHSALIAYFFFSAYRALRAADAERRNTPGVRVMSAALIVLALVFLHYIPLMAYAGLRHAGHPIDYLQYTSLYDLVFEILLGFGAVMQVMEDVARELEWSNRQLVSARDEMEMLARVDPLTETLNRHGLALFLARHERNASVAVSGSVALVDMDELKKINDSFGHAAGDAAIRSVAKEIRSLIRADDLLIRWGGDEFLIVLFGVSEVDARYRLDALAPLIAQTDLPGAARPVRLTVSCGVAPFSPETPLEAAIERADNAMYAEKQSRRVPRQTAAAEGTKTVSGGSGVEL